MVLNGKWWVVLLLAALPVANAGAFDFEAAKAECHKQMVKDIEALGPDAPAFRKRMAERKRDTCGTMPRVCSSMPALRSRRSRGRRQMRREPITVKPGNFP